MPGFVGRIATRWTRAEILGALAHTLWARTGLVPSRKLLAILWSQTAQECGRDGQYCWNHNAGNLRGESPRGNFTVLRDAWEIDAAGNRFVPAMQRFRAYDDIDEGVADMVRMLAKQPNFRLAWNVLMAEDPDPAEYVHAAKLGGYFTASEDSYRAAVVAMTIECARTTHADDWPVPETVTRPSTPTAIASSVPPPREPGLELGDDGAVTPLRAGDGEDDA